MQPPDMARAFSELAQREAAKLEKEGGTKWSKKMAKRQRQQWVVRISVSNREADCILPHPHIEGLLLDVGNVVVLHLQ